MPNFQYKAYDKKGQLKTGLIEAANKEEASELLKNLNLTVTFLEEKVTHRFEIPITIGKKVSSKELVFFSRQLATMIKSGLTIIQSLRILEEQTANQEFKKMLTKIADDVETGISLSQALSRYPKTFNKVYVSMVKSGESSGRLEEALSVLADQLENNYKTISKIRSAMVYPSFILLLLIAVAILMIVMVIPQLKSLFEESNLELPWTTRLLIYVSDFFRNYWWVVILIVLIIIFGFYSWINSKEGRKKWDRIKLKIPIFGKLFQKIYLSRFTRNLGTLINSGLPILRALEISSEVIGNTLYEESINKAMKKVEAGSGLGKTLKRDENFPIMVAQMIEVGEKTGKIDDILIRLAEFFESEIDSTVKSISSLLEPILMVLMGVGVAILVASVIMPIYGLVQAF